MRIKACKRCGKAFEPASKHTYLCPECHAEAKATGTVRDRTCRKCGATFLGGLKSGGSEISKRVMLSAHHKERMAMDVFLRKLDSTKIKDGVSYKRLTLLERSSNYLYA